VMAFNVGVIMREVTFGNWPYKRVAAVSNN
jgi:hypothetical protein